MERSLFTVLCAAIMAFTPAAVPVPDDVPAPGTAGAAEYRCLAVGTDLFVNEENTSPCSANNAELMAALLEDCLPEGTRITRRINGPGSTAEMEELILEAFRDAGEEDTSLLYVSTHGVTWEEEDGETRAALILSDGVREEGLEPGTLRAMMDRVPGKKVLILDCCHAGMVAESFRDPAWRVLAGCGPEEDCYFWAAGEATGTGYFTSALENALRAAGKEQIDPDGDGTVSLCELAGRIREIYGVSSAVFLPEGDENPLFLLPAETQDSERILNLRFDPAETEDGQITVTFHFRTETPVKIEYRLVPMGPDGWEFDKAARLPDRERTGHRRGVLSPGEKDRTVRISREKLGDSGRALLQIVSFRGLYGQVPVPEATYAVVPDAWTAENGEGSFEQ